MRIPSDPWRAAAGVVAALAVVVAVSASQASEEAGPEEDPAHCLALALYWEARGDGRDGMIAVGSVVLNRVDDPDHPPSVCAVVREGGENPPCAFSFWCDGASDEPTEGEPWALAQEIAREMLSDARPPDPTGGAVLYHNGDVNPDWAAEFEVTARIGNHVFYR